MTEVTHLDCKDTMLMICRDWKKLTFYYFADSYINFNSLVTDLFKIYKTRIWMSAINPASFASPTLGIPPPSGIGPGAVGVGRSGGGSERRQNQQGQEPQPQQFGRGFRPAFGQPFGSERGAFPISGYPQANYAFGGGAFGNARSAGPYNPNVSPEAEGYAPGFPQANDFPSLRQRFPGTQNMPTTSGHPQGMSPISPQADWTASFQGLSLNTH